MMRRKFFAGASLVTLAPGLVSGAALTGRVAGAAEPSPSPAPRVECATPGTLHLRRFEDRSAQLLCGRRVLVRVSVPG